MECVTADPTSGASRTLDQRRRQSAAVRRPAGNFIASSPISPVSSGLPSDLGRDGSLVESNLARRLAQMEQRLLMLNYEYDKSQNRGLSVQRKQVGPYKTAWPSPSSPRHLIFHYVEVQDQTQAN